MELTTREQVANLFAQGITLSEIARRLDRSKATISYHLRKLGHAPDERYGHRYDWAQIKAYYDAGHSFRECQAQFGFNSATWFEATRRGAIVPRPHAMPIDALLGFRRDRGHVKQRLVREGLKSLACESCGIASWLDRPLSLELHPVNGVRDDNRLENLQLLCPNCHSQTDTFAGRNKRPVEAASTARTGARMRSADTENSVTQL